MTTTYIPNAEEAAGVGALRDLLDGEVVTPADPDWDEARRAWNLAADQRPTAVVYAESAADVVAVVEYARDRGLYVTTQGTGHFANTLDSFEDTILVKTSRMRGLEIDAEAQIARAEAGVIWEEVILAAAEHGLAGLAGSSPDVGVVGYTLGGGLGWLARRYGLAANSVLAVEVVTADGRQVRADRDNEPDSSGRSAAAVGASASSPPSSSPSTPFPRSTPASSSSPSSARPRSSRPGAAGWTARRTRSPPSAG